MNPVIKFTTLFGLLAVELAVSMKGTDATGNEGVVHSSLTWFLTAAFFVVSMVFVYRSFYSMQIGTHANK